MNTVKTPFKELQVGYVFPTNEGGSVTVTNIVDSKNISVRHNDNYGHTAIVQLETLNNGQLKNPYYPNIHGVGYFGVGPHVAVFNGNTTSEYGAWKRMLERCYLPSRQLNQPTYVGCTVDSEWHNFQTFAHWYCNQIDYGKGYDLDKDILVYGNKIYGPDTCVLVPHVINNLFVNRIQRTTGRLLPTGLEQRGKSYRVKSYGINLGTYESIEQAHGVYLNHRQEHILSIAYQHKDAIDPRVYYAIIALAHSGS